MSQRLIKTGVAVIVVCSFYLIVVLLSFNPYDPSWSQTAWHESIYNFGGSNGAWIADIFLVIFGGVAYLIPLMILMLCWITYRHQHNTRNYVNNFSLLLRLIGKLTLILTFCGLAALNFNNLYYFKSGGIIGSVLSNAMLLQLSNIGATLVLLCFGAAGVTLFTGWSWLIITNKISGIILSVIACISDYIRHAQLKNHNKSIHAIHKPKLLAQKPTMLNYNLLLSKFIRLIKITETSMTNYRKLLCNNINTRVNDHDNETALINVILPSIHQYTISKLITNTLPPLYSVKIPRVNSSFKMDKVTHYYRCISEPEYQNNLPKVNIKL